MLLDAGDLRVESGIIMKIFQYNALKMKKFGLSAANPKPIEIKCGAKSSDFN